MTLLVLRESRRNRQDQPVDSTPSGASAASMDVESPPPEHSLGLEASLARHPATSREQEYVQAIRDEIDGYFCQLKQLNSLPPDGVFAVLSSLTARLGEIRLTLVRSESRRMTALRTKEVDPLIEECDRQFRLHSRIQTYRMWDWDVSAKGQI